MANNWDDEFTLYNFDDFDIPSLKAYTEKQEEMAATPVTPEENTETPVAEESDEPNGITPSQPIVPDSPTPEEEDEKEEEEDSMGMENSIAEAKKKQQLVEERQEQLKKKNTKRNKKQKQPQDPLAPAMELIETAQQLKLQAEDTEAMMKQISMAQESSGMHVKGMKSTLRRLDDNAQVLLAAQAIVDTLSKTGNKEAFETLKTSRFISVFKNTKKSREFKEQKVKSIISDLTKAFEKGDKDETASMARLLKQHAMRMEDDTHDLAAALFEATSIYPDQDGQLALFSMIADEGDTEKMTRIDHAMRLSGQVVVPVGDAKAMLKARAEGDQQTIDDILDRVITSLVEEEKV